MKKNCFKKQLSTIFTAHTPPGKREHKRVRTQNGETMKKHIHHSGSRLFHRHSQKLQEKRAIWHVQRAHRNRQ